MSFFSPFTSCLTSAALVVCGSVTFQERPFLSLGAVPRLPQLSSFISFQFPKPGLGPCSSIISTGHPFLKNKFQASHRPVAQRSWTQHSFSFSAVLPSFGHKLCLYWKEKAFFCFLCALLLLEIYFTAQVFESSLLDWWVYFRGKQSKQTVQVLLVTTWG